MCLLSTKPVARKQQKSKSAKKDRGFRWVYSAADTMRLLEDGILPAPLIIRVGENSWCYLVELLNDGTYRLQHTAADNSGADVYAVDLRLSGRCDCNSYRYRREFDDCKHIEGLRAAMAWLASQTEGGAA